MNFKQEKTFTRERLSRLLFYCRMN